MNTGNSRIKLELAAILDRRYRDEIGVDEVLGLMLQISFALLMVFIIAYYLYRSNVGVELEEVKQHFDKPLIEKQRQILLNALDKTDAGERNRLGLSIFTSTDENGNLLFKLEGLLENGRITENPIVRDSFVNGCRLAREKLPFRDQFENEWFDSVISEADLKNKSGATSKSRNLENLTADNKIWLKENIGKRIKAVSEDSVKLQRLALSQQQSYYRQHPETLNDPEISNLIKKYSAASPEEKEDLISLLRDKLYQHAKKVFEEQGVPLLNDI